MKILIVEDNVPNKLLLLKILKKEGHEVSQASNGIEALEILAKSNFDAVLTDWMMPKMDGIELIENIRIKVDPVPAILVITAIASRKAKEKAINSGADEFIEKPYKIIDINTKLNAAVNKKQLGRIKLTERPEIYDLPKFIGVGIAASTGGPSALVEVLKKLKFNSKAAYFVVLHGPAWMLESFAKRLETQENLPAVLAQDEMPISPGKIYLSPGNIHMAVGKSGAKIVLFDAPPENFVKPAADPLFRSIAENFGNFSVCTVLTGMGHDGSIGAGFISAAGGVVIAQDPNSATVASMPKTIIDLRIAKHVSPLEKIAELINENVEILFKELLSKR